MIFVSYFCPEISVISHQISSESDLLDLLVNFSLVKCRHTLLFYRKKNKGPKFR